MVKSSSGLDFVIICLYRTPLLVVISVNVGTRKSSVSIFLSEATWLDYNVIRKNGKSFLILTVLSYKEL